jgi:hypothetical protein
VLVAPVGEGVDDVGDEILLVFRQALVPFPAGIEVEGRLEIDRAFLVSPSNAAVQAGIELVGWVVRGPLA